jgi:hypothetical protein
MGLSFGLPRSLDESRKQAPRKFTVLPSAFRMPLDSNNEPARHIFHGFNDTIGSFRCNAQVVAGTFNALMVKAVDVNIDRSSIT